MVELDLSIDGVEALQARLEELKEDGQSDHVYVVGPNTEYDVYLEFGTENMPPYPYFRPAIQEFKANPRTFITDNTGHNSLEEIETTDELVRAVAVALSNQMTDNVSAQDPSADRSPGTHPDHPSIDTGNLAASIKAVRVR